MRNLLLAINYFQRQTAPFDFEVAQSPYDELYQLPLLETASLRLFPLPILAIRLVNHRLALTF